MEHEEGCLSLPGVRACVPRAAKVQVVAYTLGGERVEMDAEDRVACAWQHEMDHLNGLLIIDRLCPTALTALRDQLKKLEQEAQSGR
jgi:peptide deformylase